MVLNQLKIFKGMLLSKRCATIEHCALEAFKKLATPRSGCKINDISDEMIFQ
jgi:hypothetical protein